ncbi:MAG: hypothetical protein NNA18_09435 [Nitrospira sp.]|nr:hypothetical protein [Nitrospira sp.]
MDPNDPTTVAGRGFGIKTFAELFTPRQMLCLLTFAAAVREAMRELERERVESERVKAVGTYLGVLVNRIADKESTLARWDNSRENSQGTFGRQALPMVWDFVEPNPLGDASGGADGALDWIVSVAEAQAAYVLPGTVLLGSATALPWSDVSFDAVITDPPYYDNIQYAALSDFFYVWLKRTIGHLFPEHFATEGTPMKQEAVADSSLRQAALANTMENFG